MARGIWKYNTPQGQQDQAEKEAKRAARGIVPVVTGLELPPRKYIRPPSNLPSNPVWRDYLQDSQNTTFIGVPCSQWHSDLWLWERFFSAHKVASMVEIGTGRGGLSLLFLLQSIQRSFSFNTFDLLEPLILQTPIGNALHFEHYFHQGDVKKKLKTKVEKMLKEAPHPIVLFCDGGDKVWEVQTFSTQLISGDYVAVHDWNKSFKKENIPANLEQTFTHMADKMGSYSRWMKVK